MYYLVNFLSSKFTASMPKKPSPYMEVVHVELWNIDCTPVPRQSRIVTHATVPPTFRTRPNMGIW
jgi:hypothetical protein